MKKRKWMIWLLALCLGLSACAGGIKQTDENASSNVAAEKTDSGQADNSAGRFAGQTLKLTSVTKDLEYAAAAFEKKYGAKVEVTIKTAAELAEERARLLSGEAGADIYTIEAAEMKDWLEAEALLPLTEVEAEHYAPYTIAYATDKAGLLRALTWTATPVNLYYRRSAAKAVLADDLPETVAQALATPEGLAGLAAKLQTAGYKIFANVGDMKAFYQITDKTERTVLSPQELAFLEAVRQMETNYQLASLTEWSKDWFKGMYGEAANAVTGNKIEIFGYVMPSWGKSYVLENAGNKKETTETEKNPTWGDWAMTTCPAAAFSEGLWLGIAANSGKEELAKEFLLFATQNQAFLQDWLMKTQELPAFLPVLESYQTEMEDSFLGGQRVMPLYAETIKAIPAKSAEQIWLENEYYKQLEAYMKGDIATIEELQAALTALAVPAAPAAQ